MPQIFNTWKMSLGLTKERDHWGGLGADGRIFLKYLLKA
jgi:hypothetical protein